MSDRVAELEAKVAELSESLGKVQERVALLERGLTPAAARRVRAAAAAAAPAGDAATAMLRRDAASVASTVSLAGRTLLVLAGAFFLRALTETGRLPTWIGIGMGFVYAGIWIAQADRSAARRDLASAGFHGAAAAAIPAAYALMFAQGRVAPPLLFLVVLGTGTVWLGYVLDWHGLRWPVAFAADLAVLFLAVEAVRPGAPDGPVTAVLVQFALMAAYLGSTAVRTLGLRRNVVVFEMVQSAAVLVTGLGAAAFVTARTGMGTGALALGALSLAFGAGAYAIAFTFVERERTPANFYFYTTAGAAFLLAGATFLMPGAARGLFWAALAFAAALGARKAGRRTLAGHAATFAVAAALASGLISHAVEVTIEAPDVAWSSASLAAIGAAVAVAACAWALGTAPVRGPLDRVPRVVLLVVLAVSGAWLVIGWVTPAVAGAPARGPTRASWR